MTETKEEIVIDQWQLNLENKLKQLQDCQKSNSLKSCTPCTQFFECEKRKTYVQAVYESMSKGSSGGFEF
ncbi:MAG: hypothetical protein KGV43_01605 [Arcobacter sp.]|nr:hypothetical protein [Arcobacter sp.]